MSKVREVIRGMIRANRPSDYWLRPEVQLPELDDSLFVIQRNEQSVWEHTMLVLDLLTLKNDITLLSGLFHDLGKGDTIILDCTSSPKFPGHAEESAIIAKMRLSEWGATPYLIDRVARLILTHMFDISNALRDKTIRKFVADVGLDNIENWFVVRVADSRSYFAQRKHRNRFIEPFRKAVASFLKQQPSLRQPDFEVSGDSGAIQIKGRG